MNFLVPASRSQSAKGNLPVVFSEADREWQAISGSAS